uniref:Uncharacterized protein n=1 Tax=Oncorhynchus tshawytscha TaxID=74940 RepID=A0AAZ3RML1_ONCTS
LPPFSPHLLTLYIDLFILWVTPLFSIGNKRRLEEDDMYQVLPDDASQGLGEELQRHWDKEVRMAAKELRMPKLTKAIVKCYGKPYAVLGIFSFTVVCRNIRFPVLEHTMYYMYIGQMLSGFSIHICQLLQCK